MAVTYTTRRRRFGTAADVARQSYTYEGGVEVSRQRVVLDGTYATGGFAFAYSDFGFTKGCEYVEVGGVASDGTAVYAAWFDDAAKKIKLFNVTTGAQLANATDVTNCEIDVTVAGYR